jgi:hypothetical protein
VKPGCKTQGQERDSHNSVDADPVLFWVYNNNSSSSNNGLPQTNGDTTNSHRSFNVGRVTALTSTGSPASERNRQDAVDVCGPHQTTNGHNQPFLGAPSSNSSCERRKNGYTVGDEDLSDYMSNKTLGENQMERFLDELPYGAYGKPASDRGAEDREQQGASVEEFFDSCGSPMVDSENHHVSSQCNCLSPSWTVGQYGSVSWREIQDDGPVDAPLVDDTSEDVPSMFQTGFPPLHSSAQYFALPHAATPTLAVSTHPADSTTLNSSAQQNAEDDGLEGALYSSLEGFTQFSSHATRSLPHQTIGRDGEIGTPSWAAHPAHWGADVNISPRLEAQIRLYGHGQFKESGSSRLLSSYDGSISRSLSTPQSTEWQNLHRARSSQDAQLNQSNQPSLSRVLVSSRPVASKSTGSRPPAKDAKAPFTLQSSISKFHTARPRKRFSKDRRKEVAATRQAGACFRCRLWKITVSTTLVTTEAALLDRTKRGNSAREAPSWVCARNAPVGELRYTISASGSIFQTAVSTERVSLSIHGLRP